MRERELQSSKPRWRERWDTGWRRSCGLLLVAATMLAGSFTFGETSSQALPRGESLTFPGGLVLANFVLPGGQRAYCIEVVMGEPTGVGWSEGHMDLLPGRTGMLNPWQDREGMRQMNYLLDVYGQSGDAWNAAAVQLTIWRMRENFLSNNPLLNQKIAQLNSSQMGRDLIAYSDLIYADAKLNAIAPQAAPDVTGQLSLDPDPSGAAGKYLVSYPSGAKTLSVVGGTFSDNDATSLTVAGGTAGTVTIDITPGAPELKVSGTWETVGRRGWEPLLDVYATTTADGGVGQRVALPVGKSTVPTKRGVLAEVVVIPPPPEAPPVASSQAQPSAEVGGTMIDELRVVAVEGTTLAMWPEATAGFTAYLEPVAGDYKYSETWEPMDGVAFDSQAEEADGAEGADALAQRDKVRWSEEELAAMTSEERCTAQPVYSETGIPVPGVGSYTSTPTPVKSAGTIYWVEHVESQGVRVHEGECGLPNETTKVGQPGVVTLAPSEIALGEEAYDVATVTGNLVPGVSYTLSFEAYRAPADANAGSESPEAPSCTAENLVFSSPRVPVTSTGDVRSPGFIATPNHGEKIWWVETLELDDGSGPRLLHRGACGLDNETTRIAHPAVETLALAEAVPGDHLTDTAVISGNFATNAGAQWELEFRGYRAARGAEAEPGPVAGAVAPTCDASNLLFEIAPVAVSGPGEITSEPLLARPEWQGEIWWVETLWLTQDGERTPFSVGECGLATETTFLTGPAVETLATPLVAVGDAVTDVATVSGNLTGREGTRHELTFDAYRGDAALTDTDAAQCLPENQIWSSEPVIVTGPGDIESPPLIALPEHGDTIWWVESLWLIDESALAAEEQTLLLSRGRCGVLHETTTVQKPMVSTVATSLVTVGEKLYDTAIVDGLVTTRPGAEMWVRFDAYTRPAKGQMTCDADTRIDSLSDEVGVLVTGPGRYTSKQVTSRPEHVGLGGYVETLVLIENGTEHVVHRGECGAPAENFEVVPLSPRETALSRTGVESNGWGVTGIAIAVAGLAILWSAAARKRAEKQ